MVQLLAPQSTGVHWYGPGPTGDERRPPGSSESGGGGCVDVPGKGWGNEAGQQGERAPALPKSAPIYPPPILMVVVINVMLIVIYTLDP